MRFNNVVSFGNRVNDQEDLRHIPQFFRADAEYVYRLGGPLMRKFLDALPLKGGYKYLSIDSRVHMLMPGFWPCIPGWHCDDFYRPAGGQPELQRIIDDDMVSMHHAMVVGWDAMTEFMVTPLDLAVPSNDALGSQNLYKHFNQRLENLRNDPRAVIETRQTESGVIVSFDCFAFHRGMQAQKHGWRLFVRATESNCWEPKNEIRTQTQVYLTDPEVSW